MRVFIIRNGFMGFQSMHQHDYMITLFLKPLVEALFPLRLRHIQKHGFWTFYQHLLATKIVGQAFLCWCAKSDPKKSLADIGYFSNISLHQSTRTFFWVIVKLCGIQREEIFFTARCSCNIKCMPVKEMPLSYAMSHDDLALSVHARH